MSYLQAIILAIIEGLTEFIPVSSTGHMVIASSIMGIQKDEFVKLFEVVIQFGAILAVVVIYYKNFFQDFNFYLRLLVGFIPAIIFGLLFYKHIKSLLESPLTIAIVLVVGGVIMLFIDDFFKKNETGNNSKEVNFPKAFIIGCFQVLAMIFPGLSRSAATIVGGLSQGLTRKRAAEFSFFLAVPTMAAASIKDGYEYYKSVKAGIANPIGFDEALLLIIGNVVAFIVAFLAIRSFISFFSERGFKIFGIYRIILGLFIIALIMMKVNLVIN